MVSIKDLNVSQRYALQELLEGKENIFLTGSAGTGKSFVIKMFREISLMQGIQVPIVASTGAASILVNGVTFNSYFGLGIMLGGIQKTVDKALTKRNICERIVYADTIIVDEISMISGEVFQAANLLCQKVRNNKKPFGGIRVICVGDFAQLGPYSETNKIDWVFKSKTWTSAKLKTIQLKEVMRTSHLNFLEVLNYARVGKVNTKVINFLKKKVFHGDLDSFEGSRILSRNKDVDEYNEKKLNSIKGSVANLKTQFVGETHFVNQLKKNLIIKEIIQLKKGCLVMTRVNNQKEGYINGTLGHVQALTKNTLTIRTLEGKLIKISVHIFEFLNGAGKVVAAAKNFPVTLAWAITIQKSQGASLDKALIDLRNLWLPGQAYTALSRLKTPDGLFLVGWDQKSIMADKSVLSLYKKGRDLQILEEKRMLRKEKRIES